MWHGLKTKEKKNKGDCRDCDPSSSSAFDISRRTDFLSDVAGISRSSVVQGCQRQKVLSLFICLSHAPTRYINSILNS